VLISSSPLIYNVLSQLVGIGLIGPLYYFFHYLQCPIDNYMAADNRLVQMKFALTLLPAMVLGYVLPVAFQFGPWDDGTVQSINALWQIFPLTIASLHWLFSSLVADTTNEDRLLNPLADLVSLRRLYAVIAVIPTVLHLYVRLSSPTTLLDIFFGGIGHQFRPVELISEGINCFLKYDSLLLFAATFYWIILNLRDLKEAGILKTSWATIILRLAGLTLVCGPGAAIMTVWAWREELLAEPRKLSVLKNVKSMDQYQKSR
jgi:hypothetical protein